MMRKLFLMVVIALASAVQCFSQAQSLPRFEDYPASGRLAGKPAPAKIVGKRARLFRTMLRENAARGPNFAGHYTLATWGCGSDCKSLAIIDARTGGVHFLPQLLHVLRVPFQAEEPLQFRPDSRLLIVVGDRNLAGGEGKYFYEWVNNRLRLIRSTKSFRKGDLPF
jgi:hypothetical protein